MRTGTVNVQALLAQAQAKLSGTTQQTSSGAKPSESEKIGKISPALAQVHQRITAQSQTATASLSALGKFKSDLDGLGSAAKEVAALTADSGQKTVQAVQAALEKMVSAYNASLKSGATASSTRNDGSADRAQRELRNAIDKLTTPSAGIAQLGLTRQENGTLALDTKALAGALAKQPAPDLGPLKNLAEGIAGSTTKSLSQDSRLSSSLSRLGQRAQALQAQQAAVVSTANQLAELGGTGNSWSAQALAAYRRT